MLEVNEQFFQHHPEECEKANVYLQGSLSAAEQGNHRWANNHCTAYLRKTLQERPELTSVHTSLVEALARVQKLAEEVIDPLWEKHQDSFSS